MHLELQGDLALLYHPVRGGFYFIYFSSNSKKVMQSMRKWEMATHRLAYYSLWTNFSTLATVTLQKTTRWVSLDQSLEYFLDSHSDCLLFFCVADLRSRNSLHTSLTGDTRFTLKD